MFGDGKLLKGSTSGPVDSNIGDHTKRPSGGTKTRFRGQERRRIKPAQKHADIKKYGKPAQKHQKIRKTRLKTSKKSENSTKIESFDSAVRAVFESLGSGVRSVFDKIESPDPSLTSLCGSRYAESVSIRPPRTPPPDGHLIERRVLADATAMTRMLRRMANEIVERNGGVAGLVLVGIRTGGLFLASRLQPLIADIEGEAPALGAVDITLYRDDVFEGLPRPEIGPTDLPFDLDGATVVLVDDVLYTGRTVRAALDALMDWGRPRAVQLAVLVDRGLRELPIRADYVGLSADTTRDDSVKVRFAETGETDCIVLRTRSNAP